MHAAPPRRSLRRAPLASILAVLGLGWLALAPAPAEAATYTVNSVGAFDTALAQTNPGDTIVWQNGTYSNKVVKFDGKLSANGVGGSSGSYIVLKPETPGGVVFNGTSRLYIGGKYMRVEDMLWSGGALSSGYSVVEFRNGSSNQAQNCRLYRCGIYDYNPASSSTKYKWVSIYGKNNRVDRCRFEKKSHIDTIMTVWLDAAYQPANHTIELNYFGDFQPLSGSDNESIRIGTSSTQNIDASVTVANNLFYDCSGEAEIISSKSDNNLILYNTFDRCEGSVSLRHGDGALVEGNFFEGHSVANTGGVRVSGEDHTILNNYFNHLKGTSARAPLVLTNGNPNFDDSDPDEQSGYEPVTNCVVAFNTWAYCDRNFVIGLDFNASDTTPPADCIIANSIVRNVSTNNNKIIDYDHTPSNMKYEGDWFYGNTLGITQPSGVSTANPKISSQFNGTYHLDSNSPCINASANAHDSYSLVDEDMDGQARPSGTSRDAGADEYFSGGGTIVRGPLSSSDVGPYWW